jgi:hypothetical protein
LVAVHANGGSQEGTMAAVNYNTKNVSDAGLKEILQKLAETFNKDINVSSGDRATALTVGAGAGSLHLQNRAVDFHVDGETDDNVYARIKANYATIFSSNNRYEVIQHGPYTETMGAHVHIGVYTSGVPAVLFKQEGLTPATKKEYSIETMPFPTPAH